MARKIVTPVEVQASVTGDQSVKSLRDTLKEAQQEADKLAKELGKDSEAYKKAAENVAKLKTEIKDGNIKTQLKEAQFEAFRLAQALGQTSPEALKAAGRVAELKDQMDDFNATVAGMHPDKFAAVGKVVGTLANGFAAAQGAAALLGSESEDLQKAMVRVQGAMALAQGVAGFKDLQFVMAGVRTFMLTQLVPAFTTVAGAARMVGMALGIGLIITAVTLLITHFDKLTAAFRKFAGLPDHAKIKREQEERIKGAEREIELMEARQDSEIEIMKAKANAIVAERKMLRERESLTKEEKERHDQLGHELNLLLAKATAMRRETQKKADEERNKEAEKQAEQEKARQEKAIEVARQAAERKAKAQKDAEERKAADLRAIEEREQRFKEQLAAADAAAQREQEERDKRRLELDEQYNKARAAAADAYFDALKARLKAQEDLKQSIEDNAIASAQALISILGEQSKVGKAIALAQIAYDTGKAISGALSVTQSSSPDNVATGGLAGIAKYVAISAAILTNSARAIRIVKSGNVQQGGGGNLGGMNGGRGVPQPSFTSSTLGGGTQFAGSFDNKVYVTEGDITGTQRRVRQNRGVSVI